VTAIIQLIVTVSSVVLTTNGELELTKSVEESFTFAKDENPKHKQLWGSVQNEVITYIHTYHSRFIHEGVAETSQKFLRDAQVLPKLFNYE
jgi:hypothetical protein